MDDGSNPKPETGKDRPEPAARRGSTDSIDDVFLELKLAAEDISSSDEEAGTYTRGP
jgi:hypothetical protein